VIIRRHIFNDLLYRTDLKVKVINQQFDETLVTQNISYDLAISQGVNIIPIWYLVYE